MEKHIPNFIAALWLIGFLGAMLLFSRLVRPNKANSATKSGFNSGEENQTTPWIRMSARHHVLVVLAAIFFLGIIFLYPAVVVFKQMIENGSGLTAVFSVGIFLLILLIALFYAHMRGDLDWIMDIESKLRRRTKERNGNS